MADAANGERAQGLKPQPTCSTPLGTAPPGGQPQTRSDRASSRRATAVAWRISPLPQPATDPLRIGTYRSADRPVEPDRYSRPCVPDIALAYRRTVAARSVSDPSHNARHRAKDGYPSCADRRHRSSGPTGIARQSRRPNVSREGTSTETHLGSLHLLVEASESVRCPSPYPTATAPMTIGAAELRFAGWFTTARSSTPFI